MPSEQVEGEAGSGNGGPWAALSHWLDVLWKDRRFIVRFSIAGTLMAVLVALALPSRYQSITQVVTSDQDSSNSLAMLASLTGPGSAALATQVLGIRSSGAVVLAVVRSRTVQNRLIDRFKLRERFGVRTYEQAREILNGNTSVFEDRKSGVISLTYTSSTPEDAAAMAKAYIEEVNRLLADVNTSSAHRERIFLEERLRVVKQDLDKAAQEFSRFAAKNSAIDIPAQGKAMVEGAARLHGEMVAAQAELRGLEQIYSDSNVRVRALRARVAELRKQQGRLATSDDSDAPFPSLQQLPALGVTYADLYRQTRVQEAVYEILIKQYELAKVQEAKETPTVRTLDEANVPETRSRPERRRLVSLGLLLSFIAALVITVGRVQWQGIDPDHPLRQLGKRIVTEAKSEMQTMRRRVGDRRSSGA